MLDRLATPNSVLSSSSICDASVCRPLKIFWKSRWMSRLSSITRILWVAFIRRIRRGGWNGELLSTSMSTRHCCLGFDLGFERQSDDKRGPLADAAAGDADGAAHLVHGDGRGMQTKAVAIAPSS